MSTDHILLKWGTLKGWQLTDPVTQDLCKQYFDLGTSMSCAMQRDSPEQKELLRKLILAHKGTITNDWSGEEYTQEQAIDYLTNYGVKEQP